MGTVTPILDTLLHRVMGRRADMARFTANRTYSTLLETDRMLASRDATTQTDSESNQTRQSRTARSGTGQTARGTQAQTTQVRGRTTTPAGTTGTQGRGAPPSSAQLHFSPGARTIARILSQFPMPTATVARTPLFDGAGSVRPRMFATALAQQLANSGVFYESHLRQWMAGRRSIGRMRQEPQAHMPQLGRDRPGGNNASSQTATARPATGTPAQAAAAQTTAATTLSQAAANANAGAQAGHAQAAAGTQAGTSGTTALLAQQADTSHIMHQQLQPVVRQQLDVLANAVFRWDGVAWPGVPMQWEVEEQKTPSEQKDGDADGAAGHYATRLKLELPELGELEVQLMLTGNRVRMFAWAGSERGESVLGARTGELQERLEQAGFDAASVQMISDRDASDE